MTDQQSKHVIVVLGSGRCGTSLVMQVLHRLGMTISENLVPAKAHNIHGPMEDAELAAIYDQEILSVIGSTRTLPIVYGAFPSEVQNGAKQKLRDILKRNVSTSATIWGFKDPYTSSLLPLWFSVFNAENVIPIFILAVRNPGPSAVSRRMHFGVNEALGELAWLSNYVDALHHTGANCYIVHYEDWFVRPGEVAGSLLKYAGLDQYFAGDVNEAIKDVVKPNLNRAVYDEYQVQNEYVLKLYDVLKECRGDSFDRSGLMEVVKECRKAMDGFKGWYLEAQRYIGARAQIRERLDQERDRKEELKGKLDEARSRLENRDKVDQELRDKIEKEKAHVEELKGKLDEAQERVQVLETDLEGMVLQNNRLLKASKDYFDQSEELRKALVFLKNEKRKQNVERQTKNNEVKRKAVIAPVKSTQRQISDEQVKKMRQEIIKIRYRYSFRLGKILTDAILRPGKNTVLMPYYLIILFWDIATGRGRRKMEQVLAEKKLA